jgi:ectoine hydroxylase-related dioxygenase (phytanoyl-CoA dioxygenase family)
MNLVYTLAGHGFHVARGIGDDPAKIVAAVAAAAGGAWRVLDRADYVPAAGSEDEEWRQDHAAAQDQQLFGWLAQEAASFSNGGLKFCPSSHRHGVLSPRDVKAHAARPFAAPELAAGDLVVMNPLTIHSSAKCEGPRARLVRFRFGPA